MPLFKFCNPEHNIHRGAQVQVGTLFLYRGIENPDLRDEHEGKYSLHVMFPEPIELDRRWTNLLMQGMFAFGDTSDVPRFPGRYRASVEKFHIVEVKGNSVVVRDTRILIEREVLNCLMFCMSAFETAENNPFPEYTDNWSIPEQLATEFGRRLGSLIFQQVKLSSFDESLAKMHTAATITALSLNVRHQRVIYRDREIVITPVSRPSFDELVNVLSDIAFVKPKKYSAEQEYRFVFELGDGRNLYQPKIDRLLVNPNLLTSLQ